ncbi:MAG TPA: hypothetical protein EYH22_02480 [Candidatus Nanopusillus sp.]|nr:hypothetical protein [Candidatus Nanopusillus sp.]
MKAKYLLPVLALLLIPTVFAQSVDIEFVEYPNYVTPETLQQTTLSLKLIANVNTDDHQIIDNGYDIADPTLYVYVLGEDGRILYEENLYVGLAEGVNTIDVYIPGSIIAEKLSQKDGSIRVIANMTVVFTNGTNVITRYDDTSITIYIKDNIKSGELDIIYLAPNLTKQKEFDRRVYTFLVGIKNDGSRKANNVAVYLRVYDQYGVRKINLVNYMSIGAQKYVEARFDVNFGILEPGHYKLAIEVYKEGLKVFEKEYPIIIAPLQINAIKVYDVSILPPEYEPGDLVLIKMTLRNVLDKPIVVKPELVSEDLNLYRSLSSFEFAPGEAKEFKVVVPLPEDLKPGRYHVTLRFMYNQYVKQDYKVVLRIPGGMGDIEQELVTAELLAPSEIIVGENKTAKLILTSHVEDIIPVKIEAYATKVDIKLSKDQLIVGGIGLKKKITLDIIGKQTGKDNITVEVIDLNTGKVLAKIEQPIDILPPSPNETKTITRTILGKDKLIILIGGIIILAAIALFLMKRKEEEEKPSE